MYRINGFHYALNSGVKERLISRIDKILVGEEEEEFGSDVNIIATLMEEPIMTLEKYNPRQKRPRANGRPSRYRRRQGAFWPYRLNLEFVNLIKYGVFHSLQEGIDEGCFKHTCFVWALLQGGIDPSIIENIKLYVKNRFITLSMVKKIAEHLDIIIHVSRLDKDRKKYEKIWLK